MNEDKKDFPSSSNEINQKGSFGVGVNQGNINNYYSSPTEKSESPQNISPQAVAEFLQAIETRFQYLKFFHVPQERVLLQDQYIPIEVTLERRYKHDIETIRGYAESEAELPKIYAPKRMAEETRKEQVKWEEARKKHQKLIVLADPGMGKSTLLRMEALKIATEGRGQRAEGRREEKKEEEWVDEVVFPLFLRLSDLAATEKEVIDIVPELIKKEYGTAAVIEPLLKKKLRQGKCVLLLDALDEVPKEERLELGRKLNSFARNYDCPIVCTSRIVGYGGNFLDGAKEVEIVPFNKQQREAYIEYWFTNAAEYLEDETVSAQGLIRELQQKPQISGLAQNPLLLSLLCSLYQVKELELPARRTQIYHQVVKYMLGDWSKENERKLQQEGWVLAKTELLEFLAYQLSCENKEVFLLADVRTSLNKYLSQGNKADFQQVSVADVLDELTEADGIIQKLSRDGDYYLFLHRTFQEYLTAAYLQKKIVKNQRQGFQLVIDHIWEYDWHETIALVAGLMADPMLLIKSILRKKDDIFHTLLLLAGLCLAECDVQTDPLVAKVIEKINKFWLSYPNASFITSVLVALGKSNYEPVVEALITVVQPSGYNVRVSALEAFSDRNVRVSALEALGEIGNKQAIPPLITVLQNSDLLVEGSAAYALGEIGDYQAVEALITVLQHSDDNVRICAAEALGKIGSDRAIKSLMIALHDSDYNVRIYAAKALGKIGSDQVIKKLITALKDPDFYAKISAVFTLRNFLNDTDYQDDQEIELLIDSLNNSDTDESLSAAEALLILFALGKNYDDQEIELLIDSLNNSDTDERTSEVEVFGKFGDDQVIKTLITALQNPDLFVSVWATEILGKLSNDQNDQVIKILITALQNSDTSVRNSAVYALGVLGITGNEQVIEPLINALKDSDDFVRSYAVSLLGEMGNEQAVKPLTIALKDSGNFVRSSAARVLGIIGSEQAVKPLTIALKDSDNFVRRSAAEALGNIGNEQAIKPLITALKDSNNYVRSSAAEALGKIGSPEVMEQFIHNWYIDIYDAELFPIARKLAVRYSRESLKFIPVYPNLVRTIWFSLVRTIWFSLVDTLRFFSYLWSDSLLAATIFVIMFILILTSTLSLLFSLLFMLVILFMLALL